MQPFPTPALEDSLSILTPTGYQRSSCGYCHSKPKRTRASVGFVSTSVRAPVYQILVDRGWRRSGTYYYKPDNRHSCCPQYTIRLDATAFDSRRDQRQAINRWNKYILGQEYAHKAARYSPKSREEKRHRKNSFDLYEAVHESEYGCVRRPIDSRTKETVEPAHKFEMAIEPDNFTEEKYALFADYQKRVHHEGPSEISRAGFKRFLCSGLHQGTITQYGKAKKIGSYHQCYRLEGKLVALGVLDLLPHCVSSVYLMYHEDVSDWNFGKLSALREISLAQEGNYKYYYMGYYIHSCIKMRYKATFRPTYILDPQSNDWDPLDSEMMQLLSARKWVSMAIERSLGFSTSSLVTFLQSDQATASNFQKELTMGPSKFKLALEYIDWQDQKQDSNRKEASDVFTAGTPGALSLEELAREVDLGQWKLKLGQRLVKLEMLAVWEGCKISDSSSIKRVAAELAACIGPELVKITALHLG